MARSFPKLMVGAGGRRRNERFRGNWGAEPAVGRYG